MINLLIRSDASVQMGTGHIMRCLALAQAVRAQDGLVYFAIAACPPALEKRLQREGFSIYWLADISPGDRVDAQQTSGLAQQLNCHWICMDGYQFGTDYQQWIQDSGCRSLFIDDYGHASFYYADLVLNQNLSAQSEHYQHRHSTTQLLLGASYTLLRQEFWPWRGYQRTTPKTVKNILITLGGSDPDNGTAWILNAFQEIQVLKFNITVIVGGSNPHRDSLLAGASRSIHTIKLIYDVTEMPNYIADSDLAIAAGGSTNWELALLGLPSVMVTLADNQVAIAQALHAQDIAISLGYLHELQATQFAETLQQLCENVDQRRSMSQKGQALIDGEGADRVVMAMRGDSMRLRPVKWQDCEQIWQWANEPTTRQASFQSTLIPWEQHLHWFKQKLDDVTCYFWIAVNAQDQPIGQVRFDRISTEVAQISISVDQNYRNQGLGIQLLNTAIGKIFRETTALAISAWIKPDNSASICLFEAVQFVKIGPEYKDSQPALHYQLKKSVEEPKN